MDYLKGDGTPLKQNDFFQDDIDYKKKHFTLK